MKNERSVHALALALAFAFTSHAHAGPKAVVIEGSNYIGGCNDGLRKVDGAYHCPPDNQDGGRTPPGYFWDPSSNAGYALGQITAPNRTGAYIKIVQTGQYCSGFNQILTYNNGTTADQGYNASCVASTFSGLFPSGGNGTSGTEITDAGGGSGGIGGNGASTGGVSDGFGGSVGSAGSDGGSLGGNSDNE